MVGKYAKIHVMVLQIFKKIEKDRCGKHLVVRTLIGRPMKIGPAAVSGKRKRFDTRS
jgi:hypothetical protein